MTQITIPTVGVLTPSSASTTAGAYETEELPIVLLGTEQPFTIDKSAIEALDAGDISDHDLARCIANFRDVSQPALDLVTPDVYAYFRDVAEGLDPDTDYIPDITGPHDVWEFTSLDDSAPLVTYDAAGGVLYVVLTCEVEWEDERDMQLVFEDGARICKVGPHDGVAAPDEDAEPHPDGTGLYRV